jgi:predicted XRE-type DNA-binding protein
MDAKKRKRLEEAGWAVGDAKDFLKLSEAESLYVETKLALADALVAQRKRRGVSQQEAAEILESSQSRVSKMEAADPTVSIDLMVQSYFRLGADRKRLANVIAPSKRHFQAAHR